MNVRSYIHLNNVNHLSKTLAMILPKLSFEIEFAATKSTEPKDFIAERI